MLKLQIERKGGFGGFGGKNAAVRSHGEIDFNDLATQDQKTVNDLFKSHAHGGIEKTGSVHPFRCTISRMTADGIESVEADEEKPPDAIRQCVKDEFI